MYGLFLFVGFYHLFGLFFFFNFQIYIFLYKKSCYLVTTFYDSPYGIRTRVTAVKRRCLNPLTNGPFLQRNLLYQFFLICQHFLKKEPKIFGSCLNIWKFKKLNLIFLPFLI